MMYGKAMVFCTVLVLSSCSDGGGSADSGDAARPGGDHVWKSQTDMIDRAKGIEDTVMEQSDQQRQTIDDQAR
jgi:hypothetical protein